MDKNTESNHEGNDSKWNGRKLGHILKTGLCSEPQAGSCLFYGHSVPYTHIMVILYKM